MELNDILLIGSFIISVVAAIIAVSKRRSEVNLNEATEAEKISAAWERLNKPNDDRIKDLETRLSSAMETIEKLRKRVIELEAENTELRRQNKGRGLAFR